MGLPQGPKGYEEGSWDCISWLCRNYDSDLGDTKKGLACGYEDIHGSQSYLILGQFVDNILTPDFSQSELSKGYFHGWELASLLGSFGLPDVTMP